MCCPTRSLLDELSWARKSDLGDAYADGTAVAVWYPRETIPSAASLVMDARWFAGLLAKVYEAQDLCRTPDSLPVDVAAAMVALDRVAHPFRRAGSGQAYGLTQPERRSVELRAMDVARQHLESEGFAVRDVSATESFDLLAKGPDGEFFVEVKGTTGSCESILLTAPEVALHRRHYPHNALMLVHGINIDRAANPPVASGGTLNVIRPWFVRPEALEPTAYRCKVAVAAIPNTNEPIEEAVGVTVSRT